MFAGEFQILSVNKSDSGHATTSFHSFPEQTSQLWAAPTAPACQDTAAPLASRQLRQLCVSMCVCETRKANSLAFILFGLEQEVKAPVASDTNTHTHAQTHPHKTQ